MACLRWFKPFLVETPCSDPISPSTMVAGDTNADEYTVTSVQRKQKAEVSVESRSKMHSIPALFS